MRWRGGDVTPDAIIFRSAPHEGGKNIAIMGDAGRICRPAPAKAEGAEAPARPSDDYEFMDLSSPLHAIENAGLEYVDSSIEPLEVESAVYSVDTYYASPQFGLGPPDMGEPDF